MKKIIAAALAALLLATLAAGCGKKDSSGSPAGTPAEIIERIYKEKKPELMVGTQDIDVSDTDALKNHTGLSQNENVKEAAVSQAMIGSQAYSLVVLRVKDAATAAATAKEMLEGVDPAKWICVQADEVEAAVKGDVILLVMVQSELGISASDMVKAFEKVCGGAADETLKR